MIENEHSRGVRALNRSFGRGVTLAILVVAGAWSLATLTFVIAHVRANGLSFVGPYGVYFPADQLRYLAWIRDAGLHGLIADPLQAGAAHLYLNPVFLVSGLLWRAGLSIQAAYLVWTPLAFGVLMWGYARFTGSFLSGGQRAAALALSLLFLSPLVPALDYGGVLDANGVYYLIITAGHGAAYWQEWGYLPTAMALGLMPVCVLGVERLLQCSRNVIAPALAAAAVAWLHPWGGIELVLLILMLLAWRRMLAGSARAASVAGAAALPLLYYAIIAGDDSAWSLAQLRAAGSAPFLWPLLIDFGLLLVVALPAIRRPDSPRDQLVTLWLVAALVVYCVLGRDSRGIALEGVTLPLAILAVRGWNRMHLSTRLGYAALFLAIVPGAFYSAHTFRDTFYDRRVPFALAPGEQRAVTAVEHLPGDVLATEYLAPAIPALAGHFGHVTAGSDQLFDGRVSQLGTARLLATQHINIVVSDCLAGRADLSATLGALGFTSHRYGCAMLYRRAG